MGEFFAVLLLLSFAGLTLGLLSPRSLNKLLRAFNPLSRAQVGLIFGLSTFAFLVLTAVFAPAQPLQDHKIAQAKEPYLNN
jgi:hypothetical protein